MKKYMLLCTLILVGFVFAQNVSPPANQTQPETNQTQPDFNLTDPNFFPGALPFPHAPPLDNQTPSNVSDLPDIALENLTASGLGEQGAIDYVHVSVMLINDGVEELRYIELDFVASNTSDSTTFTRTVILNLAKNERKKINTIWTVDGNMDTITARIDPQNRIMESNEENNFVSIPIELEAWEYVEPSAPSPPEPPTFTSPFDWLFGFEFLIMVLVVGFIVVTLFVYPTVKSMGSKPYYVLPVGIYDEKKKSKSIYDLQRKLLSTEKSKLYIAKTVPEDFFTIVEMNSKDIRRANKLEEKFGVGREFAETIVLAKRLNAIVLITPKQVYIEKLAKDLSIKTKVII